MRNIQCFGFMALLWGLLTATVVADGPSADTEPSVAMPDPAPSASPAAGKFLLARRNLPDPNFRRTLVLIVRHGESGSLGLVVNRPTRIKLSEAIPHIEGAGDRERLLFWGGPVARHQVSFLLRNERALDLSDHLVENIYLSTHPKLLEQLFEDDKPDRELRVFAGYAGWSSGQLAAELSRGDWHLLSIDAQIVFSMQIETLWETLIDREEPQGILVYSYPEYGDDAVVRERRLQPGSS